MTIAAVDIGGTKIAVGMVEGNGRVLSRTESPTDTNNYQAGLQSVIAMLRETAEDSKSSISGIGIGSTGPVDPFTGQFGDVDFLPGWRGQNMVEDLAREFQVKVALENDADAAALAEAGWGVGRNKSPLIYVTVGTGIGGGIVIDGKLYRGVDGSHPEIGHHVIDASGPPCTCGYHGCWESLAAGPAMVAWMEKQLPGNSPEHDRLTGKRICELAAQGDKLAQQAVDREATYLGLGLANLINLFSPEMIALSGSVMKSIDLFLPGIRRMIEEGCRFVPADKTELALASLGDHTNLVGAARVWYYRFS